MDVKQVKAKLPYYLELEFINGEKGVFDISPYLDKKGLAVLKQSFYFLQAYVQFGVLHGQMVKTLTRNS